MKNDLTAEQLAQPINVTLPLSAILRLAEAEPILALTDRKPIDLEALPAIGTRWEGGIYAGLSIESNRPVALILLDGDESMNWGDAGAWAKDRGGVLPSRIDQLVLFQNLKSEFKEAWYWSGEQCAGYSGYAWGQDFGDGDQGTPQGLRLPGQSGPQAAHSVIHPFGNSRGAELRASDL
jgi:hypothetical protein